MARFQRKVPIGEKGLNDSAISADVICFDENESLTFGWNLTSKAAEIAEPLKDYVKLPRGMERQATMQSTPGMSIANTPSGAPRQERKASDLVYQGMTIAAMLLLLGSLWAF